MTTESRDHVTHAEIELNQSSVCNWTHDAFSLTTLAKKVTSSVEFRRVHPSVSIITSEPYDLGLVQVDDHGSTGLKTKVTVQGQGLARMVTRSVCPRSLIEGSFSSP